MMKMGAPAYVSTSFLHKKEHVAKNLLRVQMGVFAQTGTAVGALHPFNPAFYHKMEYGYCTEQVMYSPRPQYIRSYGDKSGLAYAKPEDEEEILEFYRQYARKTHGATIHSFMDKHRIFDEPYVVVCRRNGRITGYLTFDFVEVDHYTDMYHDLAVREIICEDMETMKQFLTFLHLRRIRSSGYAFIHMKSISICCSRIRTAERTVPMTALFRRQDGKSWALCSASWIWMTISGSRTTATNQ